MKTRKDNLKNFLSEHFCYEVEMLYSSLEYLIKFKREDKQTGKNMALENFLLHSRNLIEFLHFPDNSKKYARAYHFLDEKSFLKISQLWNKDLEIFLDRANHEVSHLTYNRYYGTPPEKNWNCRKYFLEILTGIITFLEYLPEQYKSKNIDNLHGKIEKIIDDTDLYSK